MTAEAQYSQKRVVIVDDSRSIRGWLRHVLEMDPRLKVVGEAADAYEARAVIKAVNPDVITLDIEMPHMSGLEFLSRLMRLRPLPVVMVSSATERGSDAAITALSLGALDCVVKPSGIADAKTCRDIGRRVFSAACGNVAQRSSRQIRLAPPTCLAAPPHRSPLILIGASTGGVNAIETVLSGLDQTGPPVVIVQHMPHQFLISFSRLLDKTLSQRVHIAQDGVALENGDVALAPASGKHTEVVRRNNAWQCQLRTDEERALHCPSVDALFSSAATHGHDVIAAIMTGLGRDGAEGMRLLHRSGSHTIGQDKQSCVIYGMPKVARELGAVVEELPLDQISQAINTAVRHHAELANRSGAS